jgi:branched-subunit amino acid transport protein AzlD
VIRFRALRALARAVETGVFFGLVLPVGLVALFVVNTYRDIRWLLSDE